MTDSNQVKSGFLRSVAQMWTGLVYGLRTTIEPEPDCDGVIRKFIGQFLCIIRGLGAFRLPG